jgi:acyl carrier protein
VEREEVVLKTVRAEVARVLSMGSAEAVVKDRPLKEVGLDSLMAVELRNALAKRVGKTLPATLAFNYPTPAAIAEYLGHVMTSEPEDTDHLDRVIADLDRKLANVRDIEKARRIAIRLSELASRWTLSDKKEGDDVPNRLGDLSKGDLLDLVDRELADFGN